MVGSEVLTSLIEGVIGMLLRERRPDLKIVASDVNANAVFSAKLEIERWKLDGIEVAFISFLIVPHPCPESSQAKPWYLRRKALTSFK